MNPCIDVLRKLVINTILKGGYKLHWAYPRRIRNSSQSDCLKMPCQLSKKKSNFTWFLLLLRRLSSVSPDLGFSRQTFGYRSPKSLPVTPNLWLPYSHLHFNTFSVSLFQFSFWRRSISHQTEAKKNGDFPIIHFWLGDWSFWGRGGDTSSSILGVGTLKKGGEVIAWQEGTDNLNLFIKAWFKEHLIRSA